MKQLTTIFMFSLLCGLAMAEFSYDVDITSNYIHRGVSISDDEPAISGTVSYRDGEYYASGFISTLGSSDNPHGDIEVNAQLGWAQSSGGLDYDIGFKHTAYPTSEDSVKADKTEVYAKIAEGGFAIGTAYTLSADDKTKESDIYYHAAYQAPLSNDVTAAIRVGQYKPNDEAINEAYQHYDLILNRGDVSLHYSERHPKEGEKETATGISYHKSF